MSRLKRCLLLKLGAAALCLASFSALAAQTAAPSAPEPEALNWQIPTAFRPLQGGRPQEEPSAELVRSSEAGEAALIQRHGENSPEHLGLQLRRVYVLLGMRKLDEAATLMEQTRAKAGALLDDGRPPEQQNERLQGLRSLLINAGEELAMRRKQYDKVIQSTQEHLKLLASFNEPKTRGREVRTALFLVEALMNSQRRPECVPCIKHVVTLLKSKEAPPSDLLAEDLPSFATVAQGLDMKAEVAYLEEKAVEICCAQNGGNRGTRVDGLVRIASLFFEGDKLQEAEAVLAKAQKIVDEGGTDAFAVSGMFSCLGRIKLRQHVLKPNLANVDEAEKHFQEVARLTDSVGRSGPLYVAMNSGNLAQVAEARGDMKKAGELHRQACQILEKELGPQAPETVMILGNHAAFLFRAQRLPESSKQFAEYVDRTQKMHGSLDPRLADALHLQGKVLLNLRQIKDAEKCYERAAGIRERALGAEHAETAKSYFNLGQLREMEGDFAGAAAYYEHVQKIDRKALGEESDTMAEDTDALARALIKDGRADEALARVNEHMGRVADKLGKDHLRLGMCLVTLAMVQEARQSFDEAEQTYQRIIAMRTKAFGNDNRDVLEGHARYGVFLASRNKLTLAASEFRIAASGLARLQKQERINAGDLRMALDHYVQTMRKLQHDEQTIGKHVRSLESGVNPVQDGGSPGA